MAFGSVALHCVEVAAGDDVLRKLVPNAAARRRAVSGVALHRGDRKENALRQERRPRVRRNQRQPGREKDDSAFADIWSG